MCAGSGSTKSNRPPGIGRGKRGWGAGRVVANPDAAHFQGPHLEPEPSPDAARRLDARARSLRPACGCITAIARAHQARDFLLLLLPLPHHLDFSSCASVAAFVGPAAAAVCALLYRKAGAVAAGASRIVSVSGGLVFLSFRPLRARLK